MSKFLSVVLPVHNAEAYLPACLDSLLAQNCADFEIIAVNDASTDASPAILDAYAERDGRIRCFHNEQNKNSFATRLVAFEKIRGDYFLCCDADDIVPSDAFSQLYKTAEKTGADIVHGRTLLLHGGDIGETAYWVEPFRVRTGRDFVIAMLKNRRGWNVWGKLFSRRVLEQALPSFPRETHWFTLDDLLTSALFGLYADGYVALNHPVYYYRIPPVTHSVRSGGLDKWAADSLDVSAFLEQVIAAREIAGPLRKGVEAFTRDCLVRLLDEASSSPEDRKAMEKKIRDKVAPSYIAWAEENGLLGNGNKDKSDAGGLCKIRKMMQRTLERGIRETYLRYRTKRLFAHWEQEYKEAQRPDDNV